jgi:hypothetical protein
VAGGTAADKLVAEIQANGDLRTYGFNEPPAATQSSRIKPPSEGALQTEFMAGLLSLETAG